MYPSLNLGAKPEERAVRPEVNDGTRHIGIAPLIGAHRISVCKADDLSNPLSVNEVLSPDVRHRK